MSPCAHNGPMPGELTLPADSKGPLRALGAHYLLLRHLDSTDHEEKEIDLLRSKAQGKKVTQGQFSIVPIKTIWRRSSMLLFPSRTGSEGRTKGRRRS